MIFEANEGKSVFLRQSRHLGISGFAALVRSSIPAES